MRPGDCPKLRTTPNSHLVAAGVVDVIDLTIAPMLAMGEPK
jgi:hypothetical protein